MIQIQIGSEAPVTVEFVDEASAETVSRRIGLPFSGGFLSSAPLVFGEGGLTVFVGVGDLKCLTPRRVMDAAAKGAKLCREYHADCASFNISILWEILKEKAVLFTVSGIRLGLYGYDCFRSGEKENDSRFFLRGIGEGADAASLLERAQCLADGIVFARDLVNAPANFLTPGKFAELLSEQAKACGVEVEVLGEDDAEKLGMGAFLAVGKSSGRPPRLIVLRYLADPASKEITALVGKGVTCDTGGYCLKSKDSMLGIKGDMAGGAAVANAIFVLAQNGVKTNVVGVIPSVENRISPESFVPGDIITSMAGKTVEIRNTDAEGRLILADAITYAIRKEKATRILDIATLTGSVVGTLGFTSAGALADGEPFWEEFSRAALVSGEQYWRLPIYEEYLDFVKSDIADLKNMGESYCGTIAAGLFLREFAEGLPWLHLDIAGTAWVDRPIFEHQTAGATGTAVTTLYFLLCGEGKIGA